MSPPPLLRSLGCLIFGHAPTVEVDAGENRADYVCERCRAVLGVFVTEVSRRPAPPVDRPASDRDTDKMENAWLDDGGRNGDPADARPDGFPVGFSAPA